MSVSGQEGTPPLLKNQKTGGGWLAWLIVLMVLGGGGWYYRKTFMDAPAAGTAGTPGSTKGGGKSGRGGAIQVVVASTERGDMPIYLRGLGLASPYNTVTVKSRVDGQINKVAFTEGQFVKEGDLLIEIDPRPFQVMLAQAEGQLARDTAQLNDAKAINNRNAALYKELVIAKAQVEQGAAQVGVYEGAIQSDRAQIASARLQLSYCTITAPIGGRVGLRLADPGNVIRASDPNGLLVINQLQPIAVLFSLPQDSLPEVYKKLRNNEQLRVEAFDRDNSTKVASGKLLTIDSQIDSSTGTYKLKAVFPNEDHSLFPNQFVNIRLLLDTRHGLTITPAAAIQRGPKGNYVYLVEEKKAKVRPVTVAITEGENVGISDGLEPGEVVVTDGQDKLQDNSPVDTGGRSGDKGGRSEHGGPGASTGVKPGGGKRGAQGGGGQGSGVERGAPTK